MKQRLLLSFLLGAALVYYALPKLSLHLESMNGYFSIAWLFFAFLVVGGNLAGLLYLPKQQRVSRKHRSYVKKRQHQY